jgi:hypothetical protein
LIEYFNLKHKDNLVEQRLIEIKNQFYSRENKLFNEVKHLNDFVYLLNNDVKKTITSGKEEFYLIVLLSESKFCGSCMQNELLEIGKLSKKYPDNTIIVLCDLGKEHKIVKYFENYTNVIGTENFDFSPKMNLSSPSILLVNKDFLIYSIYQAEEFNDSKRKVYFEKINEIFPKLINDL